MYRSLLVPLDGSPFAEEALPLALDLARRAGAELHLVSVAPPPRRHLFSGNTTPQRAPWQDYLDRAAAALRGRSPVPVRTTVLEGAGVARQISAHARAVGADLVVMTTHGKGALSAFWLGSVTYELLHYLPLPALLVRPGAWQERWGLEGAPKHLLLPLDGTGPAEAILEPSAALGGLLDADFTLLRVIDDTAVEGPGLDPITLSSPALEVLDQVKAFEDQLRAEAQAYLEAVADRLRAHGLRARTEVVLASDPTEVILKAAAPPGVNIVALETRILRGQSPLAFGGVAPGRSSTARPSQSSWGRRRRGRRGEAGRL
jgi:nucleotide-binding universal stress UspA family protein